MGETLSIGPLSFPMAEVGFLVTYDAERKLTEKEADGDDDATAVDGGRKVRKITVKFTWPDRPDVNTRAAVIVATLDPSQKDPPPPPPWAHERNGLDLGTLKNTRNVIVKKAKGPDLKEGAGINTYDVEFDSWSKTTKGTATTETGNKFKPNTYNTGPGSAYSAGGPGSAYSSGPAAPAPGVPVVKP
jgi:hypothetical protein